MPCRCTLCTEDTKVMYHAKSDKSYNTFTSLVITLYIEIVDAEVVDISCYVISVCMMIRPTESV
jgi:hypothetical protein